MTTLLHDVRFAIRTLRRHVGYTAAALLTLLLGIGANVAVFSVVYGVLLAPLPYPQPDALVRVWEVSGKGNVMASAWQNFVDWRDRSTSFLGLAAHGPGGLESLGGESTVLGLDQPLRVPVTPVSKGFFSTLGVEPARGRMFLPEEHRLGGDAAVIVSDAFWRTNMGADADLSRHTLTVSAFRARVVGVMPAGFDYPNDTAIWYPLELSPQSESRTAHNWTVIGRLRPGTDAARAQAELDAITQSFIAEDPGVANEAWFEDFFPRAARVESLHQALVGGTQRTLWILLGASVLVLLVAATNLASATLARGAGREREYAVRRSLGAGRGRILRQLLTESIVLAGAGALLGVGAAAAAIGMLPVLAPAGIPRLDEVAINLPVVGGATVITILTAVLFGLLPALRLTDGRSAESLRSGGRGGSDRGRNRVWKGLIAIEVAFALMLLVGAGLLIRSLLTVLSVEPGFRTEGVLTAVVNPSVSRYNDNASKRTYYDEMIREFGTIQGIAAFGIVSAAPMTGVSNGLVAVRGGESNGPTALTGDYQLASAGYFDAIGIPLLGGRVFDERDHENAPHAVVVSRSFAEHAWPGQDPLGKQMTGGGMDDYWDKDEWATVIGVVADVRQRDLTLEGGPAYYFDYRQRPFRAWTMTAALRPERGNAAALASSVREAVQRVDRDVPVRLATIDDRVARALTPRRFTVMVLGLFAATALVLACVGIWGVVSYAAARRTREIGIRMALGADPGAARRLVQRDYLGAAALGAAVGLALSFALSRVLQSLLFEVRAADPITVSAVLLLLGVAAWVASFVPSLRSSRVSPMEAMRTE
jgi:predicted permease